MEPRASYELLRRPILVNFDEGVRGYGILLYVKLTRCERRLGIRIMALSPKIGPAIRRDGQKCLCANAADKKDEVLITYDGPIIDHPTRYSIQIDDDKHIEGAAESNAYLNHSCAANAYVDWNGVYLRALRDIDAGDEVTATTSLRTGNCMRNLSATVVPLTAVAK